MKRVSPRESHAAALAKGLGRALQETLSRGALVDEEAVLDACLHARAYDPQCEDSRGPWLIEILTAGGALDRFNAPIVAALDEPADAWSCAQLCDLVWHYACQGDREAKRALYRTFDRAAFPDSPWLAEEQIVRLDGLAGALHIAERHGARLRSGDDLWPLLDTFETAREVLGESALQAALDTAAARSPDTRAFLDAVQAERARARASEGPSLRDRLAATTLEDVLAHIAEGPASSRGVYLSGWGRQAPSEALRVLADGLFRERDPARLKRYLRVFTRTALPEFDERLMALTSHDDVVVRRGAMAALAANRHPSVRALALERLRAGQNGRGTIELLTNNYEPGDHRLIETVLSPDGDPHDLHDLCWALKVVFSENKTSDGAKALTFAYEATPCSLCREDIVTLLLGIEKASGALREECAFDANPDIRRLVAA